jgi:hypothetical protein
MRVATCLAAAAVVLATVIVPGGTAVAQVPHHSVTLTGANEAPDPGDANGRGEFSWSLDGLRLCYLLSAKRIGPAAAAHIHRGAVGVAGPVRVGLEPPAPRASAACITLVPALAKALRLNPQRFYVNVHTAAFPAGAIRAQLG